MSNLNDLLNQIETKLKRNRDNQIDNNIDFYNNSNNYNYNNIQSETRNIIKNEMNPYNIKYYNTGAELQNEIKKLNQEIDNLKYNEFNMKKLNEEISEINKKLYKIEVDTSILEKNIKNNDYLYKNALNEEEKNNQNVINKYNEIEEKYNELYNKMKLIKEQQNKVGMELMTNEINENNYKQEISKSEDKLNKFLEESNLKFNNTLNEIYSNFIENTSNKDNELNMIKYEIKNSEEMVKQIKMNLKPIIEINQIQNNINALGKQMGDMNNIYNQIIKEHENIQTKNNELHQSLLNANNDIRDINNQISQNKINIDEIKNNYITKNNLKDINDKINNINNEIKALNETFENNKKLLNNANNEIKNINKTSDEIIQKEEYDKEMNKKNNEFNELKNFYSNKIDESNNNYAEIINQFNQFNEEEMNSMININKQFKDISDQVKLNNNDIKKLETENNSIYDEFILIKDKFKLLDKNISNLNKLENINVENKKEIEIINDRINNLENDLMLNKTNENNNNNEIDNLQLESLESLDNFNNKVNKENEIRENKYKELIKETQNNEMILENHINEINQKQEYNINEITNKLNEFKKQQFMLNEQNMKNIEQLNHGISEQIREYENIKQSLESNFDNNNNKKILETKINNLEREVDEWLEFSKKIDQLMVENMEKNLEKIEEINGQMKNFRENVNNQFKEMKIYIDKTIDNFSNK